MTTYVGVGALIVGVIAFAYRRATRRGIWVDPSDPLIVEATMKARKSIETMRQLHKAYPGEVGVKFPLETMPGRTEHAWGSILEIGVTHLTASLATPPLAHTGGVPATASVALSQLEDWHLTMPDGSIRGSFTTQAELRICKQRGHSVPRRIARLEGRFVDT